MRHDRLRRRLSSTRADMALNIRKAEAERLAAELAQTGETKTEAVTKALRDRLARVRPLMFS